MPHFFVESDKISENIITVSDKQNYTHIARSLRTKVGEKLLFIDENRIQYESVVKSINNSQIVAEIIKRYPSKRFLSFNLYLAQVPLRSDAQNMLIEKATELGVSGVYPILSENCALNKSVIEKKIPKWQKIMSESSKQCERAFIPTCFAVENMSDLIQREKFDRVIVYCERIANRTVKDMFKDSPIKSGEKVLVIVGPEGGFTQNEFAWFEQLGFEMLTMGDLIFRAETAVIVGLGNIIYEYSNFNSIY